MQSLSFRTEKALVDELDYLAQLNHTDRATEIRKILLDGVLKAKLEVAIRFVREGQSLGYAAEQAHVTLWDLIDYLQHTGQTLPLDPELVKQEYYNALFPTKKNI